MQRVGTTKHASSAVKLSVVPILAAGFLTGCGDDEQTAYCVDENQQVIENRYCDDDDGFGGGGFFWFFVGSSVGRGYVAGDRITGVKGERIRASDKAALAKRGGFGATGRSNSSPGSVGRVSSRSGGG
jgi:hypothetical protein